MSPETFQRRLREAFSRSGLDQAGFAALLEVSEATVSRWLSQPCSPRESSMRKVAGALDWNLGVNSKDPKRTCDLYIAAPVTSVVEGQRGWHAELVQRFFATARTELDIDTYWPGNGVRDRTQYLPAALAVEQNLPYLRSCSCFVYLQYAETEATSGAPIELGLAIGLGKPVMAFVGAGIERPHLLRGHAAAGRLLGQRFEVEVGIDIDEVCETLRRVGPRYLLGD